MSDLVETFMEDLSVLPGWLTRHLVLMRELDQQSYDIDRSLDTKQQTYLQRQRQLIQRNPSSSSSFSTPDDTLATPSSSPALLSSCSSVEGSAGGEGSVPYKVDGEGDGKEDDLQEILQMQKASRRLLCEKIAVADQCLFMIRHEYDHLKREYEKLQKEMEEAGEADSERMSSQQRVAASALSGTAGSSSSASGGSGPAVGGTEGSDRGVAAAGAIGAGAWGTLGVPPVVDGVPSSSRSDRHGSRHHERDRYHGRHHDRERSSHNRHRSTGGSDVGGGGHHHKKHKRDRHGTNSSTTTGIVSNMAGTGTTNVVHPNGMVSGGGGMMLAAGGAVSGGGGLAGGIGGGPGSMRISTTSSRQSRKAAGGGGRSSGGGGGGGGSTTGSVWGEEYSTVGSEIAFDGTPGASEVGSRHSGVGSVWHVEGSAEWQALRDAQETEGEEPWEGICPVCKKGEQTSDSCRMVGCDACNNWYHFECVNYEAGDGGDSDETQWFCPSCITRGFVPHTEVPQEAKSSRLSRKR